MDQFQVGDKVSFTNKKNSVFWGTIENIKEKTIIIKRCYPTKGTSMLEKKMFQTYDRNKPLFIEKHEIGEPEPESCHVDEKDCEIEKIEGELNGKKDDVKRLTQLLRECKSREYKYGRERITMNELVNIIKKENIENVRDFLNLFPTTSERVKGDNVTRNHVYEALWIISYAKNIVNNENKQFYKSLEGNDTQTLEEVMKGQVNSGNEGGIADLYFELIDDEKQKGVDKISCNGKEVGYPQCENKTIKSYKKNLFSSKFYKKTKGVSNYDIQDIFTEAISKGLKEFNIILLVQDKHELEKKMDKSNKAMSKICHAIYDIDDLDLYYKQLLYQEKNEKKKIEKLGEKHIIPRFHQNYFIRYSQSCMKEYKTKNFVWGAVPRSGKSFMIGGLIAEEKPKVVLLYLGAITETKGQFIKMFEDFDDFNDYEIHDLQKKGEPINKGKTKKIIIFSQEKNRMDVKKEKLPKLIRDTFNEKDKIIFFDEIHQGSGPDSLQEGMLDTIVFDNPYKAFMMVTATFAKPYLKYINKGKVEGRLIQWRYDDIHLMKDIDKSVKDEDTGVESLITLDKISGNILEENDGQFKLKIFKQLLEEEKEKGINLEKLARQYDKYPELIVSIPEIDEEMENDPDGFVINGNISVDKIFKPLMKKKISDWNTSQKFVEYIRKYIYEKYIIQTLNQGSVLRKPHSEIWFMPTTFRNEKGIEVEAEESEGGVGGFSNMTQNFTKVLMDNPWFRENYCVAILHSVGFDNTEIKFIEAKKEGGYNLKWNQANVEETGNSYCITTKCSQSSKRDGSDGIKECLLKQEACAKANGKSLIILTGKMLRLGVSLPCVDIALHMDPIKSVDTIYQSMFRVLTEREGKTSGIFIDMLTTRQITFMYEYMNYISNSTNTLSTEKKMKKLLEKLLLFNFNGINFQKGEDYQMIYNNLVNDFSLNDVNMFKQNTRTIDLNEVNELVRSLDTSIIDDFHQIIERLNINFKEVKNPKIKKNLKDREGVDMQKDDYREIKPSDNVLPVKVQKNPELKQKYDEVSKFINDMVVLFSLFSSDDYEDNITKSDIIKEINLFFENDISDIKDFCDKNVPESLKLSVIDCHLMNIIQNSVEKDKLQEEYSILKQTLSELFSETILNEDNFYKIFVDNIEQMKDIKKSSQDLKNVKPCSDVFIKDEKVLDIIRKRLTVREEEKDKFGEVFTPIELICEMFSHIPDNVWKDPDLKWLDPANGIGNFPVVAYYKLMESLKGKIPQEAKRSKHIIENMLYMVELNPVNVRVCKKIFKMIDPKSVPNIVKHDFLTFKGFRGIDKFDVIMGNPPFQVELKDNKRAGSGKTLWDKFVIDSFKNLKENGYLCFIHPPNWRRPEHPLWEIIGGKQILYLHIFSKQDGQKIFNASTRFDIYVLENKSVNKNTTIIDEKNKQHSINLSKWPFLPNYEYGNIKEILTDKINDTILYNTNYHSQKKYVKNKKDTDFKYEIISQINKGPTLKKLYTNDNTKPFFNKSKVILSKNEQQYPINDYPGEYGMSESIFGISIKSEKEGDDIVKAINSDEFKEIIKATKWGAFQTDYRMFKYFKPDFYKHFLGKSSKKSKESVLEEIQVLDEEVDGEVPREISQGSKKKKTAKKEKSKCSNPTHPSPPCKDNQYVKQPSGCCYNKPKTTKKKKGGSRTHKKTRKNNKKQKRTLRKKKKNKKSYSRKNS